MRILLLLLLLYLLFTTTEYFSQAPGYSLQGDQIVPVKTKTEPKPKNARIVFPRLSPTWANIHEYKTYKLRDYVEPKNVYMTPMTWHRPWSKGINRRKDSPMPHGIWYERDPGYSRDKRWLINTLGDTGRNWTKIHERRSSFLNN